MRYDLDDIKRIMQGESKKKCSKSWMTFGVGLVAMAAVAGAVWYFFFKDKNKDDDDDWDDDDWDDDDDDDDYDVIEDDEFTLENVTETEDKE